MHNIVFLAPDPIGGAYSAPQTVICYWGGVGALRKKRKEGERKEKRRGRERKGREGVEEGKEMEKRGGKGRRAA